jgi:hypothetical protein
MLNRRKKTSWCSPPLKRVLYQFRAAPSKLHAGLALCLLKAVIVYPLPYHTIPCDLTGHPIRFLIMLYLSTRI